MGRRRQLEEGGALEGNASGFHEVKFPVVKSSFRPGGSVDFRDMEQRRKLMTNLKRAEAEVADEGVWSAGRPGQARSPGRRQRPIVRDPRGRERYVAPCAPRGVLSAP